MFRVPYKLSKYIDYDNGKLIISKDLPKDLEDDAKEIEREYKALHNKKNDLTEY